MLQFTWLRRSLVAAAVIVFGFASSAESCPFCTSQGRTMLGEIDEAKIVAFGTLVNPQLDPSEFGNKGTTDLTLELVVKGQDLVGKKKTLTLPRYVPVDEKKPLKHLIYIGLTKGGGLDPYRGEAVKPDSHLPEYLKGSLELRDKDIPTKLKYFFKYLDSEEPAIGNDAYMEFGNADYADYRKFAQTADAATVAKWLKDSDTPPNRYGLYGSLLGHSGKKEHAKIFRDILDDTTRRFSGVDGLFAGYIMLDKDEGLKYLCDVIKDEKQSFLLRYAGLRTIRFFWDFRKDVVNAKECVDAILPLIDQRDIADMALEDLRRWERWELSERVLKLFDKETLDIPIVKRSILRYALCAPADRKDTAAFVKKMRAADADWVKDVEELLKLELEPIKPKPEVKKDVPPKG